MDAEKSKVQLLKVNFTNKQLNVYFTSRLLKLYHIPRLLKVFFTSKPLKTYFTLSLSALQVTPFSSEDV